jgi:hypothetical protein
MRFPLFIPLLTAAVASAAPSRLTCTWEDNILSIAGDHLPGKVVKVLYLEAYCRPGSTDRDWHETVIGHTTELVSRNDTGTRLELKCILKDGVTVRHVITCIDDGVAFRLTAHNPTDQPSLAHWAQPCVRVGEFTGTGPSATEDKYAYLEHSFIFLDGKPAMMPTRNWATEARYTPGQVWCPAHVPRADVNPRPLSPEVPSNGLIGCYSIDKTLILAMAWQPYQELFQGVIRCLHSDFRIGGLAPGETKEVRGKIYLLNNDLPALLAKYREEFPEHGEGDRIQER